MLLEEAVKEYTVSQAMRILDVSRQTMMEWIKEGKRFPGARQDEPDIATSPWLIPAEDVERVRQARIAELDSRIDSLREIKLRLKKATVEF